MTGFRYIFFGGRGECNIQIRKEFMSKIIFKGNGCNAMGPNPSEELHRRPKEAFDGKHKREQENPRFVGSL